jgi:hypothetical protein
MPGKSSLLREICERSTSLTSHDRYIDRLLMREASAISPYLCASNPEALQKLHFRSHGLPPHNNSQIDSNATSLILLQQYLLPTSLNTRSSPRQVLGLYLLDPSQNNLIYHLHKDNGKQAFLAKEKPPRHQEASHQAGRQRTCQRNCSYSARVPLAPAELATGTAQSNLRVRPSLRQHDL